MRLLLSRIPPLPRRYRSRYKSTGPLLLKLFATADSYYSYRADKSRRISGTLKKGRALEIKADDEIVLTLGNAGGVTAELNGKKMGPFGKPAQVVSGILFNKENQGTVPPEAPPKKTSRN